MQITNNNEILYGWFSYTQKKNNIQISYFNLKPRPISNIYLDINGKEVEVTEVKASKDISAYEDAKCVGICIKWVRSIYK